MKTIKIILGLITFLVLAFFSTGLFVRVTNYEVHVSLDQPISEVFSNFTNIENRKSWIPEIQSVTRLSGNEYSVGATYKIVIENKGQEITMTEKILAFVPNEKVSIFFDAENMLKTNEYIFTKNNGGTILQLNSSCRSDSYIMACIFPYFKGTFKAQDQTYLNNFKAYIEN